MKVSLSISFCGMALVLFTAISNPIHAQELSSVDIKTTTLSGNNGITYVNGGIGSEEADAIRLKAAEFPVHITFSEGKDGKSITDVALNLLNHDGFSIFQLQSAGPILYLSLPQGRYQLVTEYGGIVQTHPFQLADKKNVNLYLNWKADTDDAALELNKAVIEPAPPTLNVDPPSVTQ